ncbi:MAG: DNA-binding response regulator, partial [Chloroflexi bacterium]|nr:DNA-binding response regulator [Chloroflexota bacterium]
MSERSIDRVDVWVAAADPLSRAGTISQLRGAPGIRIVEEAELDQRGVALVVADEVDPET